MGQTIHYGTRFKAATKEVEVSFFQISPKGHSLRQESCYTTSVICGGHVQNPTSLRSIGILLFLAADLLLITGLPRHKNWR